MIFLGFVESFNGRLRDELLNEVLFSTLGDARRQIQAWQLDYNLQRPPFGYGQHPTRRICHENSTGTVGCIASEITHGFSVKPEERRVSGHSPSS